MYYAKDLLKMLKADFKQSFQSYGYTKFTTLELVYCKVLRNDFLGFIGFGNYTKGVPGVQYLDISYSISNKSIQELLRELMGLPKKKCFLLGGMHSLFSIVPGGDYNSLELMVSNPDDISLATKKVCGYIERYIDPFFYDNDNWEAYKYLAFSGKISERKMVIPIIYYLDGQKEKGLEFIEQKINANLDHPERAYGGNDLEKAFLINYRNL